LASAIWTGLAASTLNRRKPHSFPGGKMIQQSIAHTTINHTTGSNRLQGQVKRPTPHRKEISIAYLILVHRFPEQFKRLFRAIYHPNNHYLINVDKKSGLALFTDIELFLSDFPNAHIIESGKVVWGGYSMVQSELDGMKYLLELNLNWDFFINLSGQDFPLKTQAYIHEFLAKNRNSNFIKIANQAKIRPDTMNRIENYFEETDTGFSNISYKRPFLTGVTSYIGGQWMILTRDCCDFICNSYEVEQFEDFYQNTLIPDESFFQTVMMNTSFSGHIVNDDKRAIIWIPDGIIKLRPKTFTEADLDFLLAGDNLFARKFDDKVDPNILAILESAMLNEQNFVEHLALASD
jgi:Core-2/I-Branching enzyme